MSANPQNIGKNLIAHNTFTSAGTGKAQDILFYGNHSYQVDAQNSPAGAGFNAFFCIQATNNTSTPNTGNAKGWNTIASYKMVSGTNNNANFIGDATSPTASAGLMLSDCWRYAQARPAITGHLQGVFKVTENHIY